MMQPRFQTPDGDVYEQQGDEFVLVRPGSAPVASAPIVTRPADPRLPAQTTQAQNEAAASEFAAARARADAARAQSEAQIAAAQAARGGTAPTPAELQDTQQGRAGAMLGLINQLRSVRDRYNADLVGGPSLGSLLEYLPTPRMRAFDTAAAGLENPFMAAFRIPGSGTQSDLELMRFIQANEPEHGDADETIEQKLANIQNRIDSWYQARGQTTPAGSAATTPPVIGGAAPSPAAGATPPLTAQPGEITTRFNQQGMSPGADRQLPATGERYERVDDPTLAGINARVNHMMRTRRPDAEIRTYIQGLGIPLADVPGLEEALTWRRQHPEYRGSYGVNLDDRLVPINPVRQGLTAAADTAFGASAIGAAQALSANYLPEITPGDTELNRAGIEGITGRHPYAATAGELGGGIATLAAPEAVLARLPALTRILANAPRLRAGISVANDVAYGAAAGSGANPNDRLGGAARGAALALPLSLGGRVATSTLGSMVSPTGGDLNILYREGVRPTPGQRFGQSGLGGRILNTFEQALQSYPIAGAAPAGARQLARDQFERGAFNRALREIGAELPAEMPLGTQPHAFMQDAFNEAYTNARRGMSMQPDPGFTADMGAVQRTVSSLTDSSQAAFNQIVRDSVGRRLANSRGVLTGDDFVQAQSEIGRKIRALRSNPQGDRELADALDELSGALDDAAARHSPLEAVQALQAANRGYAQAVRIETAAATRGGGTGRFTPQQYQSAVQRESGGIRSRQYLAGNAIGSEYAEAGRSLIDTLPNSGSGERLMTGQVAASMGGGGLAAGGLVEPTTMLGAGGLTLPYMPGVRRLTGAAMAPRQMRRIIELGNLLRRYNRYGGRAVVAAGEQDRGN